jgi:chromosome segregation ATPase
MTTAATQRAEREAQFDSALANAAETRNTLGHEARQLAAEVGRLTRRESELTSQLADAAATGRSLEQQLTAAADALNAADKSVSQERAARADVEGRLMQAEAALREATQQHASAITAATTTVDRLTQGESELTSQLADAAAVRSTLARQLTDAQTALKQASEAASRDYLALETKAAERTVEFDRLIRQERAARADVDGRLVRVEAALGEAERQHASAMTAAASTVDRLTQREAELTSQLADAAAARRSLEQQLTAAADALNAADKDANRDRLAAETKTAEREVEFDRLIRQERAVRADVEGRLAQVEAALREAQEQHASALTAAASEQAERQARFELELSQTAATRDEFKRRHSDAEVALAAARQDHAAAATEVERRTQHERALTSQLTEAAAMRSTLEQQLTDAATALREANESASRDRLALETNATERRSD